MQLNTSFIFLCIRCQKHILGGVMFCNAGNTRRKKEREYCHNTKENPFLHMWRKGSCSIPQLIHISVILNFYIKIRKLTWAISPKCIHHTVWSRGNSPTKKATIHQTTANSYQQWEQHNIWAKFLMPFM